MIIGCDFIEVISDFDKSIDYNIFEGRSLFRVSWEENGKWGSGNKNIEIFFFF